MDAFDGRHKTLLTLSCYIFYSLSLSEVRAGPGGQSGPGDTVRPKRRSLDNLKDTCRQQKVRKWK